MRHVSLALVVAVLALLPTRAAAALSYQDVVRVVRVICCASNRNAPHQNEYVLDSRLSQPPKADGSGARLHPWLGTASASFVFDVGNRLRTSRDALGNATELRYEQVGCGCTDRDEVAGIHTPDLPAGVRLLARREGRSARDQHRTARVS